jgi:hypothetical protein
MVQVTQTILKQGEFIGHIRSHKRYGRYLLEPIGHRIDQDGGRLPLYYGEIRL